MSTASIPTLSHFGVFCRDLPRLKHFYTHVFGLVVTDEGPGRAYDLVFLSGNPRQHHQLVLASGRGPDSPSTVMQLAFKVDTIDDLREIWRRAEKHGATELRGLNHGNALSIYFLDIEGNTVEVYLDTPWYVAQPHGDHLDLNRPDKAIWAETEQICRTDPTFMTVEEWQNKFAQAE